MEGTAKGLAIGLWVSAILSVGACEFDLGSGGFLSGPGSVGLGGFCDVNSDCASIEHRCVEGVCSEPCDSSKDCPCVDGYCHPFPSPPCRTLGAIESCSDLANAEQGYVRECTSYYGTPVWTDCAQACPVELHTRCAPGRIGLQECRHQVTTGSHPLDTLGLYWNDFGGCLDTCVQSDDAFAQCIWQQWPDAGSQ